MALKKEKWLLQTLILTVIFLLLFAEQLNIIFCISFHTGELSHAGCNYLVSPLKRQFVNPSLFVSLPNGCQSTYAVGIAVSVTIGAHLR